MQLQLKILNKMSKYLLLFLLLYANILCAQESGKTPSNTTRPFILGVVEEIKSIELNENRLLNVYLPDGYNEKDTLRYPVIYLLDGSADEDFIHIVGLVQFNSFEWVNVVPKSIVVGIANIDRRRDFTFPATVEQHRKDYPTTGGSSKFINFIEKELQPFIEKKYKTNSSKTIIGQSLGGLLATEILFNKPHLFQKYIIISPSLWWDNGSILDKNLPYLRDTYVYIGVGKEGLAPTTIPRVMEVDANVLADKIKKVNKNGIVYFDFLPYENHGNIMHQAVYNAMKKLYKSNSQK